MSATTSKLVPTEWRDQIHAPRVVAGKLCGLQSFAFTTALLIGLKFDSAATYGYTARYCYETAGGALVALRVWDGVGDPAGPWIKEKISGRLGPGALE